MQQSYSLDHFVVVALIILELNIPCSDMYGKIRQEKEILR